MKKVIYILVMLIMLIGTTGCFNKKITTSEFKEKMESQGYIVNISKGENESSSEIEEVAIASKDNYEIKFYVLTNSGTAIDFSEDIKKEWINSSNYTEIKRKDNTLLVINVPSSHKNVIKKDIKTLGY